MVIGQSRARSQRDDTFGQELGRKDGIDSKHQSLSAPLPTNIEEHETSETAFMLVLKIAFPLLTSSTSPLTIPRTRLLVSTTHHLSTAQSENQWSMQTLSQVRNPRNENADGIAKTVVVADGVRFGTTAAIASRHVSICLQVARAVGALVGLLTAPMWIARHCACAAVCPV
jgi:hypothetical protein